MGPSQGCQLARSLLACFWSWASAGWFLDDFKDKQFTLTDDGDVYLVDGPRALATSPVGRAAVREWSLAVWKSKFYGAFVLNRRVVLHAIDATPARWRGDAGSSPLDRARTAASSPRNDLVLNCRCTRHTC